MFELFKNKEEIEQGINGAKTKEKDLQLLLHKTACSIILHVAEHREISLAVKLVNNLPKGYSKIKLTNWFEKHGKMKYDKDAKSLVYNTHGKTSSIEDFTAVRFWEVKADAVDKKEFKFKPELETLLTKAISRDIDKYVLAEILMDVIDELTGE